MRRVRRREKFQRKVMKTGDTQEKKGKRTREITKINDEKGDIEGKKRKKNKRKNQEE